MKFLRLADRGGLPPAAEAVISVYASLGFGELGTNRLADGMLDGQPNAVDSGCLEYKQSGRGHTHGRAEAETAMAGDGVRSQRVVFVDEPSDSAHCQVVQFGICER